MHIPIYYKTAMEKNDFPLNTHSTEYTDKHFVLKTFKQICDE